MPLRNVTLLVANHVSIARPVPSTFETRRLAERAGNDAPGLPDGLGMFCRPGELPADPLGTDAGGNIAAGRFQRGPWHHPGRDRRMAACARAVAEGTGLEKAHDDDSDGIGPPAGCTLHQRPLVRSCCGLEGS